MITVHMVFNAHIDPIWLWPWQDGLDEALATCRSACDRLDAHPDLIFTRGEAWVYRGIERTDPVLFRRIRRHVEAGRWEIVGGWWIQPDCNLPGSGAFRRQIGLGKRYFLETFGSFPRVAYNVDSFGHAASLPEYLREAGQDRYVMFRPQEHEMALPARVFRWRGRPGGPEVAVFRIAGGYCTGGIPVEHVQNAASSLPPGVEHTMCFVGLGDHGGGPTEEQIRWVREHERAVEGCRLVFSSPGRFFDAIESKIPGLPAVVGELQQHAVGCYTVVRAVKTALRRAEDRLEQAEVAVGPGPALDEAWRKVCLHHFHDTLGGSAVPSAYPQALDDLGYAASVADDLLQHDLRSRLAALPDDPCQRIVLFNASDAPFDDWVECEPWLGGWRAWSASSGLLDEAGRRVPVQSLHAEALVGSLARILFRVALPAGGMRVLRIRHDLRPTRADRALTLKGRIPRVSLELVGDPSDTWSHGLDRYGEHPSARAVWGPLRPLETGPLMAAARREGTIGSSGLEAEWRVYAGCPFVELRLTVDWRERHAVLKLRLPFPAPAARRTDGIMGGRLVRPNDGRELPLRDWSFVGGREPVGVISPDVFASDATARRLRLTLLRSPIMAHHDPHGPDASRRVWADRGVHSFRIRFHRGAVTADLLDRTAPMLHRPPLAARLTRGMPPL